MHPTLNALLGNLARFGNTGGGCRPFAAASRGPGKAQGRGRLGGASGFPFLP